ncbi:hypothetical protein EDD86DRAFT_48828 [Gorgonomyces haynaldii]|nr:hypothetical protein EDD86DRAFT_48828 [Gorgonomyces haynaldii]
MNCTKESYPSPVSPKPIESLINAQIEPLSPVSPGPYDTDMENKPTNRRCNYCGATSTPMWRHGPGEYVNLCNSCGVKWRRGKILQNAKYRHHLCKKGDKKKIAKPKLKPKLEMPLEPLEEFMHLLSKTHPEQLSQFISILTKNAPVLGQHELHVSSIDNETWSKLRLLVN